ncbi:MAG: class I mannose-6-phosphate isomerase, partial [Kiritimatiellia bacterium]|nr:class I mannose-6-phosphate isomerase [Kiritimatiellia bacterium]
RPEGMSVVVNGPLAGRDLFSLMRLYGEKLTGRQFNEFPLLIKIIDAHEKLSVQVHPDENGAKTVGGDPKSEMWYVLAAEPHSEVYAGLKPGVNVASFKDALTRGKAGDLLQSIPVAKGDVIYIPGGRIHAIGPGCLLLEVQQNSNTTFRLFDWNRLGQDGKPRALQINKAIKVIRWDDADLPKIAAANLPLKFDRDGNAVAELLSTPFFKFEKMVVAKSLQCAMAGKTFHVLFVDEGVVELASDSEKMRLESGLTALIPAALSSYRLTSGNGAATVLRISLP